jgi:hypothetical protein
MGHPVVWKYDLSSPVVEWDEVHDKPGRFAPMICHTFLGQFSRDKATVVLL